MFDGKKSRKKKDKKKKEEAKQQQQRQEEVYQTDANGMPYGETEMALLRLHANLIDFYNKHNPENVNEEVLTILMQFFIDAGGVALNKKLMAKYGEDLQTFKRIDEPPPPPIEDQRTSKALDTLSRQSARQTLEKDYGMNFPPEQKNEINFSKEEQRASRQHNSENQGSFDHRPRKNRSVNDPELLKFKNEQDKEIKDLEKIIDKDLFGPDPTEGAEDPSLKLFLLDTPVGKELSPRDLIEAFYAKHDEGKLDSESGIEKFVLWVEEHSLQGLSDKLKAKYKEGLFDMEKTARRRRNLEDKLTVFYFKYDRPKLDTRWTILKILNWTMQNGVAALNKKFKTRYGHEVVTAGSTDLNDLDI